MNSSFEAIRGRDSRDEIVQTEEMWHFAVSLKRHCDVCILERCYLEMLQIEISFMIFGDRRNGSAKPEGEERILN
jgi:hypothetical protein